ncbi:MAG: CRTAC1 family protein [Planctomycetota bacterium]
MTFVHLLTVFLSCVISGSASGGPQEEDFFTRAHDLRQAENWVELEKVALQQLEEDAEDVSAQAYLSCAFAGQQKFDECVAALRKLEEMGSAPERSVGGVGNPLVEVFNITYMHCWANFAPEFNRKCWQGLFDAFPENSQATLMASRLLMAALKLEDAPAIARYEQFFDGLLEQAEGSRPRRKPILAQYATAYAKAGVGGERPLELAREAFEIAWEDAAGFQGYHGPDAEGGDDLVKREKCDINCDDEYNTLALAAVLSGAFEADWNPLADREEEPGVVFEEVTQEVGLSEVRQGRVAVGDYDNDGDPDLCFSGRLFRNEKGKNFVEVSNEAGIKARGASALFADYDNDGDLDLLLPNSPHPSLLRNGGKSGGYKFEDVTTAAGLDQLKIGSTPEGAAWFDLDADGWLDFYLAAYEGGGLGNCQPDCLVRNNGNGTFSDVSERSGVLSAGSLCGRGVTTSDFDQDGDTDLYVSNYRLHPNLLFRNLGGGAFEEVSEALGVKGEVGKGGQYYGHTIGSCFGDVDNDGDIDLFSANLAHPRFISQGFSNLSLLYINSGEEGGYSFTEERRERGIRFQETHSDPAFVDFDNDGDLDLSLTCVYEGVPSALYQNDGFGFFTPVTFGSRAIAFNGWGQAWFDYDDDGDLDVLIGSGSGCRFFRNGGNDNNWLKVRLVGTKGNRDGFGARLELETLQGDEPLRLVRELPSARGTTSQDGQTVHFGLGKYKGKVRLTVSWPGQVRPEKRAFHVNKTEVVRQMKG